MNWSGRGPARAVVVGGGLAGAAAAVRLAAAGLQVVVIDPNPHLGGKMNVWSAGGYRFDMGPTIITMPVSLQRLFAAVNRNPDDYLRMVRLDPQWRCFYADGSVIDLHEKAEAMRAELARISPHDALQYDRFLDFARRMFSISDEFFFWKPYGSLLDLWRDDQHGGPATLRMASQLHPFTSLHTIVSKHFRDPRVTQLFDHFVQYVGSSPFVTPAILALIAWVQVDMGVWYPMGGTGEIARALERLAAEFHVDVRTGELVEEILIEDKRATGVRLASGEVLHADVVVSNCDVVRTHEELIRHPSAVAFIRRDYKRLEPACSGVVLYLGCSRTWPELLHHNFIFSADPDVEFKDIYEQGKPADDMTIYLAAPSLTDPSCAHPGKTALYALVHTPYLNGSTDWRAFGPQYRDAIIDRLEQRGLTGLRESIEVERMLTPVEIERLYRSKRGSIYGLVTKKGLAAAFKPGNRSDLFSGLYFCGGSVNPGAGVPMVLMSGQTAADCVLSDLRQPVTVAA